MLYKDFLEETLKDITKCHGGHIPKDNNDSDENFAEEINNILKHLQFVRKMETLIYLDLYF